MNAEERLAWLLETEWVPTNRQVVFADITAVVGLEATALVVGTMKAASATNPLLDTVIIAMSTQGLSLSTPERQGVIDALATAGSWPDALRDAVKALGGVWRPRWQSAGYASEPTIADAKRDILRDELIAKTNSIVSQLDNLDTTGMTAEDVQAAFDAMRGE
jgi:hypothetical protein